MSTVAAPAYNGVVAAPAAQATLPAARASASSSRLRTTVVTASDSAAGIAVRAGTNPGNPGTNRIDRIATARNHRRDQPAAKPMKKLTAKEAAQQLRSLSRQERVRIDAQLEHDHFGKAAEAVGCDQETLAKTWKKYRHLIGIVISGVVSNELSASDL